MSKDLQEEIDLAERERGEWALALALCDLIPDIPKFIANDDKAYKLWVRAVDDKAHEIFCRLI